MAFSAWWACEQPDCLVEGIVAATKDCQHETCLFHVMINLAAVVGDDYSVDSLPTSTTALTLISVNPWPAARVDAVLG